MATSPFPTMQPHVAGIHAYVPGKADLGGRPIIAKLSSNENPFGPSPVAIAAMTEVLGHSHLYPDPASTALRPTWPGSLPPSARKASMSISN